MSSYKDGLLSTNDSVISRILNKPAEYESGRHADILSRMKQLRANGMMREEAIAAVANIYPIGSGVYRKITRGELEDAYDGLDGQHLTPTLAGFARTQSNHAPQPPKIKRFKLDEKADTFFIPSGESFADFINAAFKPGEFISVTSNATQRGDKWLPADAGDLYTADELILAHKEQAFDGDAGAWIRVNPIKDGDNSGTDASVSAFRHTLVEFDSKPKEVQHQIFKQSGLPITAIIDSGNKSLHAWVRVDAKDAQEHDSRTNQVYDYLGAFIDDKSNKNESRYSRLPGVWRKETNAFQQLIALNVGANSYEEWLDSVEERLFEIEDPLEWTEDQLVLPPVLIEGFLHKSHLGMLTGSMKTNKSWTLMELAIALATGGKWLGRGCAESSALYIDAEIQRPFWKKRMTHLCEQQELNYKEVMRTKRIRPAFVAGKTPDAGALQRELERLFERRKLDGIDLIVIDPIYQFYKDEWDENGNSDIGKLGRILRAIAELTGISIMFAHHHTKGNQDGKRDIEKASGGGAFGRFVASSLAITLINEDIRQYTLGWTTTNFPPSPRQVAYRDEFGWRISDEDPKAVAQNRFKVSDIVDLLPDVGLTSSAWFARCEEQLPGITHDAFKTLRSKASKTEKRIHFSKLGDLWSPTSAELTARGASLLGEDA